MAKALLANQRVLDKAKSQINGTMGLMGITQKELAERIGWAQNSVSNYLGKKKKLNSMSMDMFTSILEELGLEMEIRAK